MKFDVTASIGGVPWTVENIEASNAAIARVIGCNQIERQNPGKRIGKVSCRPSQIRIDAERMASAAVARSNADMGALI